MQGTVRVVDTVAIAEHIQVVALAREEIPRHRQGICDGTDIGRLEVESKLAELVVHEAHVKRRVVGDQLSAPDKVEELVGNLAKRGFVAQELVGNPVNLNGFRVHQPIRLDIDVVVVTGELAVDHLHTADFDDAVAKVNRAATGIHTCGFGIQDDLAIQLGCVHDPIYVKLRLYSLVYPKPHVKTD